ncbi:MAG: glycosyltransferase [Pseudorhodobacter sp.]
MSPDLPPDWRWPNRLAYVVSHSQPWSSNGYAIRSLAIARALREAGHEVIVFTRPGRPWDIGGFEASGPVPLDHHLEGIRHIHLPALPQPGAGEDAHSETAAHILTRAFAVFRPAAVLGASNWETAGPALRAARATGAEFMAEQRGFWEMGAGLSKAETRAAAAREADIARAARAVFTLNEEMRAELARRGVPEDRILLVPNGLTRPAAADAGIPQGPGRAAIGCQARYLLGYIGSLSAYEGVGDLPDLLARLRRPGQGAPLDVALLVVGSDTPKGLIGADRGGSHATLRARARDLGVAEHLHILPQRPEAEAAELFRLCDLIVLPRRRTAVTALVPPIKPYAAAAQGVRVVLSDLPPLARIAREIGGYLFPEGDVAAMADVVREALRNPSPPPPPDPALAWAERIRPISTHLRQIARSEAMRLGL